MGLVALLEMLAVLQQNWSRSRSGTPDPSACVLSFSAFWLPKRNRVAEAVPTWRLILNLRQIYLAV